MASKESLNPMEIEIIKKLYRSGTPVSELAKTSNCSEDLILHYVAGDRKKSESKSAKKKSENNAAAKDVFESRPYGSKKRSVTKETVLKKGKKKRWFDIVQYRDGLKIVRTSSSVQYWPDDRPKNRRHDTLRSVEA